MSKLFVPYVYAPSAESSYVELVSPWGSVQLPLSLHQLYGVVVAIGVGLLTIVYFTCCSTSRPEKKEKKKETAKAKKSDAKKSAAKKKKEPEVVSAKDAKSALEENILRNGSNSYYYAHKVREISADNTRVRQVVSTYGWSDSSKSVTIYVDHPEAGALEEDKIQMEWTPTSLCLDITFGDDDIRSLVIPTLFAEISDVSYKCKKDSIAFTLKKKEIVAWKSLNGAVKKLEEHIRYDESLYD